jgi:hypothetical protein
MLSRSDSVGNLTNSYRDSKSELRIAWVDYFNINISLNDVQLYSLVAHNTYISSMYRFQFHNT